MFNKIKLVRRDLSRWSILLLTICLVISIPIFTIVFYLFDGFGEMWDHIVTHFLLDYVQNSVLLILGSGLLSFLFGTSTAWIVSNYKFRYKKLIEWLLFLPLAIPSYIMAYCYVGLLGNGGLIIRGLQSLGIPIQKIELMNIYGLIWILSCSLFPYVYASSRAMFKSIPASIRESSDLLGVSSTKYFFAVALPLASPAIIGGLFLVAMEVLNDYGAAKYFGVSTFTTGIFRTWTMLEDLQSAVFLSAILVVIVFLINGLVTWIRGNKSFAFKINLSLQNSEPKKTLSKGKATVFLLITLLPILFGLALPLVQLIYWAALTMDTMFNIELFWLTAQSIGIGLISAFFIVSVALSLIFFSRWNYLKNIRVFKKVAVIGYVIPGAIIGIGITRSSQGFITFFDDVFSLQIGYIFYYSSIILVYAYTFRFLAVAYNPLESNSLRLGKNLHEAAYLLKSGKFKTLFKIELPLLRTALVSTSLLVFIDVMKELPLTLILKPYNLQTLAVKAFEYADDERVAEASLPALILITVIGALMIILNYTYKEATKQKTKAVSKKKLILQKVLEQNSNEKCIRN